MNPVERGIAWVLLATITAICALAVSGLLLPLWLIAGKPRLDPGHYDRKRR